MFEKSPQPLYVFDWQTLALLAVNEAAICKYGYPREEFLTLTIADLCPAQDGACFLESRHKATRPDGQPHVWPEGAWRQCKKNGTIMDVEIKASRLSFQGRDAVLVLAHDVTARKQAEEKLRESHTLLQAAVEGISQSIYVKDTHGRYLMVNSAAAQVIGKPMEEILGQDDRALFPPATAQRFREADRRVMERGQTETYEDSAPVAGSERTYLTTKTPFRGRHGEVIGVVGSSRDITERKQAVETLRTTQEFLSRLLENIPANVYVATSDGRTRLVNRANEECYGLPRDQVLGRRKEEVYPPELASRFRTSDQKVVEMGVPLIFEELIEINGRSHWFHTVKFPLRDAAGRVEAVGGISIDITDRRLAEQAMRDYSERLQALSRRLVKVQEEERRHLARELHDEIGQILTAVFYNLQVIKAPCGPTLAPRLADTIDLVDRAIRQVRTLSLRLRPALLDDLGLAAAIQSYVEEIARRTGLTAHLNTEPVGAALPAEIENSCFRIAQEALTNVVRHARAQQVWLELQQHDTEVHLTIRDDGVGFDFAVARQRAAHGECFGLLGMQERVELLSR